MGAAPCGIIGGEFEGSRGPARTFTPLNVWDLRLNSGHEVTLSLPDGFNTATVVLKGKVTINGSEKADSAELVLFERDGEQITLRAQQDATALLLSGQPIDEPIATYGPFVMNTQDEIRQAVEDYRSGQMGTLHIAEPEEHKGTVRVRPVSHLPLPSKAWLHLAINGALPAPNFVDSK